ncbi:hypothetical protein COCSADRAFT_350137 [Bipolaris sorokiniana ND90Pr]|uniref:Uncharacterized protein n=1 Tax=Cochliobolus sativus (strain ND90Pr / ATCC 201652) TaxID=665912 RepID=M2TH27_COCSN|nr:uncharacterized protein COCSADRAFT_350137 [Bipolaris sorokiniana ND90Pr]EMD68531.1 hypothetical protein COCSADRAFT_350137 [Bipolaris sorokiniana ND90Pr]
MVDRLSKYNLIDASVSTLPRRMSTNLNDPHVRPTNRRMHHGSIAMTAVPHSFSLKGVLSRWEKRWFSALAILLSSMLSLSTGSLLGLLGSMVRWPLLARKLYTPVDADLILGVSNPTGAVKLIWIHTVQKRKWCVTTVIVMVYLLADIIGRISVAAFGLTFDLNEEPRIEYPTKLTNWGTSDWFNDYVLERYRGEEIMSSNTSVVHSSSRCFWGTVSLRENQERVVDYGDVIYEATFENIVKKIMSVYTELLTTIWRLSLRDNILLESSYSTTYNVSNLLHRAGHDERMWKGIEEDDSTYGVRVYSGIGSGEHFAKSLTTRLPLLAVLGADIQLPKVTQISGASERLFIDVRLNVKLKEPITVLMCIFGGQVLAIAVAIFYCRKVFIRDYASSLSIARLLKTTMEEVEGMSTCTGEKLMEYLDRKGVMMRYGTRRKGDEALEVDLWNDVEDEFPDAIYS